MVLKRLMKKLDTVMLEFFDSTNESRVRFVLLGPKAQQANEWPLMQAQDEFEGVQVPVGPFWLK